MILNLSDLESFESYYYISATLLNLLSLQVEIYPLSGYLKASRTVIVLKMQVEQYQLSDYLSDQHMLI